MPDFTERESFREALLKGRLAAALRKLNLRDGRPWLDEARIARAVHKALTRLQEGRTYAQGADRDERGGIIWHTQGSGKSLSMVFLVRKMRTIPKLSRFKVVVVTDRTDLEGQLRETARLSGETLRPNDHDKKLRESPTALTQLYRLPEMVPEYASIILSFAEEEMLRRGVLWAAGRIAQARPGLVRGALPEMTAFMDDPDPVVRGYTLRLLGILGERMDFERHDRLLNDRSSVPIYENGRLEEVCVADLASRLTYLT